MATSYVMEEDGAGSLSRFVQKLLNTVKQLKAEKEQRLVSERTKINKALGVGAAFAGGGVVGFLQGRFEDQDGNLFVPNTQIPVLPLVTLAGAAAAAYNSAKLDDGAGNVVLDFANGALAGTAALYTRKHASAGKAQNKLWAGEPEVVGPVTHNYPRFGAVRPAALPVAQSMTDAELAASLRRSL